MTKTGSDCCKTLLKTTEEAQEGVAASIAAAKEMCLSNHHPSFEWASSLETFSGWIREINQVVLGNTQSGGSG